MNPHAANKVSPAEMLASLWRNRQLLSQLVRRDIIGRYRGSFAGIAWSLINPVLMLFVYSFVFVVVFNARWDLGGDSMSRAGFAMAMFLGMIIHGILAECIGRSPGLVLGNANYVKRVVFPLEVLPWMVLGSALFHASISVVVLVAAQLVLGNSLPATAFLLPIVILPLVPVAMGVSWILAATGIYLRDIAQVTGLLATALLFLAPVFYPISSLPEPYRTWIYINPLTFVIEQARAVFFAGRAPDWAGLGVYLVVASAFAWLGFCWFQKTRRGFADVL